MEMLSVFSKAARDNTANIFLLIEKLRFSALTYLHCVVTHHTNW